MHLSRHSPVVAAREGQSFDPGSFDHTAAELGGGKISRQIQGDAGDVARRHRAVARDDAVGTLIKGYFGSKEELQDFLNGEQAAPPARPNGEVAAPTGLDETLL